MNNTDKLYCRSRVFNVFVLSFKTFISSVYSVTGITMPLSTLRISWSFISSIYSMCMYVCMYVCMYMYICVYIYIYIYICVYIYIHTVYNKYRFRHRFGTGTVLKVSIWHRYRKKTKRYPTLIGTTAVSIFSVYHPFTLTPCRVFSMITCR